MTGIELSIRMSKNNLPPAEMDVLACLHQLGEATAAQIREFLGSRRPMAHGSVDTLLKRLAAKRYVTRKKGPVGKAFVYAARPRRSQTFRHAVRDLLQRVFHGDGAALVASLFASRPPSGEELEKIQRMLDELRQPSSKKGNP